MFPHRYRVKAAGRVTGDVELAITGTRTAAFTRRRCSRYSSGPSVKSSDGGDLR